jgi:hypothetical protein
MPLSFPGAARRRDRRWLLMMLCAYLIPQLLFRRTSGHWIAPLCRSTPRGALIRPPFWRC